ncbi:MAG: response regulator [Thiogranum sp.]|nr:response regulator [Thiogranum sp.]
MKSVKVQLDGASAGRSVRWSGAKDKILLVEDNEDDISLTVRAFQQNRIDNEIIVKRDGQEALNYLFSKPDDAHPGGVELPALVLLDINLPKLNGFEVLQQIRGSESTRLLPVVILTTSDEPEDICRGYDLGTNSYLKKPNDLRMLRTMVSEIGGYWMGLNTSPSR